MVAQVENWRPMDDIPLNSSPFSSELALASVSPSKFPRIIEARGSSRPPAAKPSSRPPAEALAEPLKEPTSSARLVIMALIAIVFVLGYVALK
jgi:hypothetical protein